MSVLSRYLVGLLCVWLTVGVAQAVDPARAWSYGEGVYNKTCQVCHSAAMYKTMKAPQVHQPAQWVPYITWSVQQASVRKTTGCSSLTKGVADTSSMTISTDQVNQLKPTELICYMLPIVISGRTNGAALMPPKGNCPSCSERELKAAIYYMLTPTKPSS